MFHKFVVMIDASSGRIMGHQPETGQLQSSTVGRVQRLIDVLGKVGLQLRLEDAS